MFPCWGWVTRSWGLVCSSSRPASSLDAVVMFEFLKAVIESGQGEGCDLIYHPFREALKSVMDYLHNRLQGVPSEFPSRVVIPH